VGKRVKCFAAHGYGQQIIVLPEAHPCVHCRAEVWTDCLPAVCAECRHLRKVYVRQPLEVRRLAQACGVRLMRLFGCRLVVLPPGSEPMVTLAEAAELAHAAQHLTDREWAFVSGALADASNYPLFLVLADWLDDHGRTAEGARVRRLVPKAGELLVGTTAPDDEEESAGDGSPPDVSPERRLLSALVDAVISACPHDRPSIVVLPHGADLQALDEEEMRTLGWVRTERVVEARATERERCRAVLRERMEHVCRFADEIAPVNPSAARFAEVEVVALRRAIDLLSDQATEPEGMTP
jgi:hypothetical protein